MADGLAERYDERIAGVLSCYDRIIISRTLPGICYAKGMTAFLRVNGIRIFDYPQFAAGLSVNRRAKLPPDPRRILIPSLRHDAVHKASISTA